MTSNMEMRMRESDDTRLAFEHISRATANLRSHKDKNLYSPVHVLMAIAMKMKLSMSYISVASPSALPMLKCVQFK